MIIGVWGSRHRVGTSTLALLAGNYLASTDSNKDTLILDMDMYGELINIAGVKTHLTVSSALADTNIVNMDSTDLKLLTHKMKKGLFLLSGSTIRSTERLAHSKADLEEILKVAKNQFDNVVVDCNSGLNNGLFNIAMKYADCLIIVLEQDKLVLSDLSTMTNLSQKVFYLCNKYNSNVYPIKMDIEERLHSDIYTVDYSSEISTAFNKVKLTSLSSKHFKGLLSILDTFNTDKKKKKFLGLF